MDETRFDQALKALASSTGRRDAVRSLGSAGIVFLAVLGLSNAADGKERSHRGNGKRGHDQRQPEDLPAKREAGSQDSRESSAGATVESPTTERGSVAAEKRGKPGFRRLRR